MDDNTKAQAAENELKKYGRFMEEFPERLKEALEHKNVLNLELEILPDRAGKGALLMTSEPYEAVSLPTLVLGATDNVMMGKIVLALTGVLSEVQFLTSEEELTTKFLDPLLLYGSEISEVDHGENLVKFSRIIPTLNELSCYVDHCSAVVRNVVHQVSALFGDNPQQVGGAETSFVGVHDVHFQIVFEKLSELLVGLVTLDEIVESHPVLRDHWSSFKRMLKTAQLSPEKFGLNGSEWKEKLTKTERLVMPLESKIFEANIFKNCIQQNFNIQGFQVTKNSRLCDEFTFCLRSMLSQLETEYSGASNSNFSTLDYGNRLKLVGLSALISLYHNLFQLQDKKFMNRYWELCKKVPGVTLHGNVMWFPDQFLSANIDSANLAIDKKFIQNLNTGRHTFLQTKSQIDIKPIQHQLNSWIVKMESAFKLEVSKLTVDHLQSVGDLLVQGIQLATNIATNVSMSLNLHAKLSYPLSKASAINFCKMIDLLKTIELTFGRHSLSVVSIVNHICQHLAFISIGLIEKAKRGLISDKRYNRESLDSLSAMLLAQKMIAGPSTVLRLLVAKLAIPFSLQTKSFREDELMNLTSNLRRLSTLSRIHTLVAQGCDGSILYWHRVIVPIQFASIFDNKKEAKRLPYIFMALDDCFDLLSSAKHFKSPSVLAGAFEEEIRRVFKEQFLDPLCGAMETELRLQVHSHLQLDDANPFREGLKPLIDFLHLPLTRFASKYIDIKAYVEAYLEKTFYNLTTLALHNWRTYGEMRALARHKYSIETGDDLLPAQTLEQGIDILEIMRNIQLFVSGYLYNLNNQIFIEKTSQNKHLNTVNINHVSNSIRTHGTGIMNTAVNLTYQFLKKKISVFSQFLFNEQIKSRLLKDLRYFRDNRDKLDQKFPYERASKFNRGIRKLGSPDGINSYLDHFRILVTAIGNAMGYIRMIRSGGLHFISKAIRFVPDLEDIPNFEKLCDDEGISDAATLEAAKNLDDVVQNLVKNFSDGSQYFQLLVSVFSNQLKEDVHMHLKNFYVIVPALTINFVEYLIVAKEKLSRKNKNGAAFTDDGLPMGIAYLLRLLGQNEDFESLHWIQSIKEKYRIETGEVEQEVSKAQSQDPKLRQTLELKLKRLHMEQKEFELLHYNLSSARIFFRKVTKEEIDQD